jgi:ADP-ribose pyrophosphatase YjhB (NUDIX family)
MEEIDTEYIKWLRKVKEETGLDIKINEMIGVYTKYF